MANSMRSMQQLVSFGASLGALGLVAIAAPVQAQGEPIEGPETITSDRAETVQPKPVDTTRDRPSVSAPERFPTEILTAEVPQVIPQVIPQVASTVSIDMAQVTSVAQLSDVKPSDWAFQSLQSLVERYGCIAGYPDKTYRGNRSMTRYEFAAGLNACLDRINDLIAASTANLVKKEDLATVRTL